MAIRRVSTKDDRIRTEPDGDTTIVGATGADVRLAGRVIAGYVSGTQIDFPGGNINFYVSGTKADVSVPPELRKPSEKVAVFGGDVVISGTLFGGSPLKIGGEGLQFADGTTQLTAITYQEIYQNIGSGSLVPLGYPEDLELTGSVAYNEWTPFTKVTDAIDDLNEALFNVANGTNVNNLNFTANTTAGPSPLTVTYTATYLGNPDVWSWKFGDGTTGATGPTITKTYTNSEGGSFTVEVTGSNSTGTGAGSSAFKRRENYITLYTPTPIPSFTLDVTSINSGQAVQLTNTSQYATSYLITWGDGQTSTISSNSVPGGVGGGSISHTYTNVSGDSTYAIKIAATSPTAGATPVTVESSTQTVKVYSTISPTFAATTAVAGHRVAAIDGFNVTFNNTTSGLGSTSTFGAGNFYRWDWGDGSPKNDVNSGGGSAGDFGVPITHKFQLDDDSVEQTFTVYLSASNGHTSSPFKSASGVSVRVLPTLTANFSIADNIIDSAGSVSLTNTSLGATSYTINWGDGQTSTISSNAVPGGVGGGSISHTYPSVSSDTRYTVTLTANSEIVGTTPVSTTQFVYVFATISPTFTSTATTGTNLHRGVTPAGFTVSFTNTTSGLGSTSTFGAGNYYVWEWGDGTTNTVNAGSGNAGDSGASAISHKFSLTNIAVTQTFNVVLKAYNSNSSSPFSSSTTVVTVNPAPIASFTTQVNNQVSGVSAKTGYAISDINNVWRGIFTFANTSQNTSKYTWTWGDGQTTGPITSGPGVPGATGIEHTYNSTGTYTVSLLSSGSYSINNTDDTQTDTVTVLAAPTAPGRLDSKTISITEASQGTNPYLAANATDNSGGSIPSQGTSITRFTSTTPITTTTVTNVSSSHSGNTLFAIVNGTQDGSKTFTNGTGETGTFTSLVVTAEGDANSQINSSYPLNFYHVFSARVSKALASLSTGYNSYKLSHSFTGDTNTVGFVKDDVTSTPSLDITSATITESVAGTYRYISGVPYYNNGSPTISVASTKIYDWIGQTYRNTTQPFEFTAATNDESTSYSVISTAYKTYANLDGAVTYLNSGIPKANTGKDSSNKYTIGAQSLSLSSAAGFGVGTIKARVNSVNGTGAYTEYTGTKIQIYTSSPTFDETNISIGAGLGAGFADSGKRVTSFATLAGGDTPTYNGATNFYTSNAFVNNATVAGTLEAIVRWNVLKHFTTNLSTGYLPTGPDLNTSRSGTQYFTFAFRRTLVQNFKLVITTGSTGVAGVWIAAPGTGIDSSSGLNGWLTASVVAPPGQPGSNTGAGGNGSDGCAATVSDRILPNTQYTSKSAGLTLRTISSSNSTGNVILVRIGLSSGQTVTSISITA